MKKDTNITKATLFMPMQSIGRCGKSTIASAIIEYLNFTGYEEILGIDADGVHETFHKWYDLDKIPFKEANDFNPIFNNIGESGITVIDMPAQATDEILEAFEKFGVQDYLEKNGIQLVIPIFMQNDLQAQQSAMKVARALPWAKFMLIACKAFPYDNFKESETLMSKFKGSPLVELPTLSDYAMEEHTRIKKAERKDVSFIQAVKLAKGASQMEFDHFRNRVFTQLEDTAKEWFHEPKALKKKVVRVVESKKEEYDEFDL